MDNTASFRPKPIHLSNLVKKEEADGVRLQLTPAQLDTIGSGRQLILTSEQRKQVQAKLGKEISDVRIVYDEPDGEVAELGYNLALRDRPEGILLLAQFAMNPTEVTAEAGGES